jgi:hypothetical protein
MRFGDAFLGQESFCAGSAMTDDDYIEKLAQDPEFKEKVLTATASLTASGRTAPVAAACLAATQVIKREMSTVKLTWNMAFVTSFAFNEKWKIMPESVPGITVTMQKAFGGGPCPGVLIQLTDDLPADLRWIPAECSTQTDYLHLNYVHDKTDIHAAHGFNVFQHTLKENGPTAPDDFRQPKGYEKLPKWSHLEAEAVKAYEERKRAAQGLPTMAPTKVVTVISTSLLGASAAASASSAEPRRTAGGKKSGGKGACAKKAASGGGGGVKRKYISEGLLGGFAGANTKKQRAGMSEPRGGSAASCGASITGAEPRGSSPSVVGSKKHVGGGSQCGTEAGATDVVKLGGVRGLSKIITVLDVLNGYPPRRELNAAALATAQKSKGVVTFP